MRPLNIGGRRERTLLLVLLTLVITLTCAIHARAAEPTVDSANLAFAEGRYGEAAGAFEGIVARRGYSAPILFDLGNAYLRAGKPVRAMLAYERAQMLAPHDAATAENLALARTAAGATDEHNVLERVVGVLPLNAWVWAGVGGFWLTVAMIGAASAAKRRRPLLLTASLCAAIVTGASAGGAVVANRDARRALVMDPAPVLVSPFASAQSDFALPPGSRVELGHARGGYVFVSDSRGRSGWVERAQLEPLVPRPDDGAGSRGAGSG